MLRIPQTAPAAVAPRTEAASTAPTAAPATRPTRICPFEHSTFEATTTPAPSPGPGPLPAPVALPGKEPKEGTGPANSKPHLTYYGGQVLDKASLNAIYVGDYWNSGKGASERQFNDSFQQDIGHSSLFGVLGQYGVGEASFGQSTVVGGSSPRVITDQQIQQLVAQQIAAGTVKADAQGLYTVMLPPGTVVDAGIKAKDGHEVTSQFDFAGYHGYFMNEGKPVFYAAIPYASQNRATMVESHEIAEAVTDPVMTWNIPDSRPAWYDSDSLPGGAPGETQWGEIADISNTSGQDAPTKVDGFYMQPIWSNVDNKSEVAPKTPGPVAPLPAPSDETPLIIN